MILCSVSWLFSQCAASSRFYRSIRRLCNNNNNLAMTLLLLKGSCAWMSACVRVLLLMSNVNDSIRLFLNALVTPMGHSARESAHSAERDQTLAGHQTQTHTLIIWTRTHATHRQSAALRSLIRLFVCFFFAASSACASGSWNNTWGAREFRREWRRSLMHQGECMFLWARVWIGIWSVPLQCSSLPEWNIHATAAAHQI